MDGKKRKIDMEKVKKRGREEDMDEWMDGWMSL